MNILCNSCNRSRLAQLIDAQAKRLLSMLWSEPGFLIGFLFDFFWGHHCCLRQTRDFSKQRTQHAFKIPNAAVLTSLVLGASIGFCWRHNCCLQQTRDLSGQNTHRAFKIGLYFGMNLSHTWQLTISCQFQRVHHMLSIQTGMVFFFFSTQCDDEARFMFWCFAKGGDDAKKWKKWSEDTLKKKLNPFETTATLDWHQTTNS